MSWCAYAAQSDWVEKPAALVHKRLAKGAPPPREIVKDLETMMRGADWRKQVYRWATIGQGGVLRLPYRDSEQL
jgi:hypothetical protein